VKIILSKEDIETIIKNIFDIEAMCWNDDGTLTLDTILDKLVNEKSKFNTDDLKKILGRTPTPYQWIAGMPGNSNAIFSSPIKKAEFI
jgi:acid phosphatase family membrane protein YuiD